MILIGFYLMITVGYFFILYSDPEHRVEIL